MTMQLLLYAGVAIGGIGFAVSTVVYLIAAFFSNHSDVRSRRLRRALASGALATASVLSAVASFYLLLLLPSSMHLIRPEYTPPFRWSGAALSTCLLIALYAGAILLIKATWRAEGLKRRPFLIAAVGCAAISLGLFAAGYGLIYKVQVPAFDRYVSIESREWQTRIGGEAPEISVTMLDGTTKRLSDFRGRIVLLNFFATWCGPCNAELPHLQRLWDEVGADDRIEMLIVNREEPPDVVTRFLSERGFTFPVALDQDARAFKLFAEEGIPRTYLIGRDGTILFQTLGFGEDLPVYQREMASLRRIIAEELLAKQ